jgi:hypothetical protein
MNKIFILIAVCVIIYIIYLLRENFDTVAPNEQESCFRYTSSYNKNDKNGYEIIPLKSTKYFPPLMHAICSIHNTKKTCELPKYDNKKVCQWGIYGKKP